MNTDRDSSVDDPKYTKTTDGMDRENQTGIPVSRTFPRQFLVRDRDHRFALLILTLAVASTGPVRSAAV
jgi:hypothetical protein